ncbi:hypothetical protein BC829DRAFT_388622 [Chytridium lagenaria]|nr:hypothetical protein BC829DRAFT_388622 [Chytridium lagenaria]
MRTILITGSTSGIGREIAIRLSTIGHNQSPRSRPPLQPNATGKVLGFELDLASLHSVKKFVGELGKAVDDCGLELDTVVLNAGMSSGNRLELTEDGIERCFATNQMGHFYLTKLLTPRLLQSAKKLARPSRITVVSSGTHNPANHTPVLPPIYNPHDWVSPNSYEPDRAYSNSKLANVLFGLHLTTLHSPPTSTIVIAVHLNLISWWYKSPNQNSSMERSCEFYRKLVVGEVESTSGDYYSIDGKQEVSDVAKDVEKQKEFAAFSEHLLVEKGFA